jgi:hypothetical protein
MNRGGVNKPAERLLTEADVLQQGSGISIVRVQMVREGGFPYSPNPVRNSSDAAKIFRSYIAGADREYYGVLNWRGQYVSFADRGLICPEREGG